VREAAPWQCTVGLENGVALRDEHLRVFERVIVDASAMTTTAFTVLSAGSSRLNDPEGIR
jgi:hypothetical protein